MNCRLIIFMILFIGLIQSCNNRQSDNQSNLQIDSLLQKKYDSISNYDILEANKKYKIKDSLALRLIKQINDFREIIDWKYKNDSTIVNEVIIDGVPNDINPDWTIMISQYQPRIQISHRVLTLLVNATNGNIRIWDVQNDTVLTLDSWRKKKKK